MTHKLPTVAIVGRPNVGKSTLFNVYAGERRAIVSNIAGTTRDSLVERVHGEMLDFLIVDTAGLTDSEGVALEEAIQQQAELAMNRADAVVFLIDGKANLTQDDRELANKLRKSKTPVIFGVNKLDDGTMRDWDVMQLGLGEPVLLSARNFSGTDALTDAIEKKLETAGHKPRTEQIKTDDRDVIKVALVGRPNVGKSSLFNKLIGKERSVVSDTAGTTRDTLDIEIEKDGQKYLLLDTAGLRRPGKLGREIEYWSTVRTQQALEECDVCAILLDAIDGVTHQDQVILGRAVEAGKGIVLCVNKFDLARERAKQDDDADDRDLAEVPMWGEDVDKIRDRYLGYLTKRIKFLPWVPVLFFSAKTGRGVQDLYESAAKVASERKKRIPTADLNRILPEIAYGHVPPSVGTKLGKMKYLSQVASMPPKFLVHVNNEQAFHPTYRRYVENQLRERYGFFGTPIVLSFRDAMDKHKGRKK